MATRLHFSYVQLSMEVRILVQRIIFLLSFMEDSENELWNFPSLELSLLLLPWTKVPSLEILLPRAKVPWNFRSRERKFQGTYAPRSEHSSLDKGVQSLVPYVDEMWIQSLLWPAKSLTAFQSSVRTHNDVEGWHMDVCIIAGPYMLACWGQLGYQLAPILIQAGVRGSRAFVLIEAGGLYL